jgi:uncharacterized protein (DUF305 family)
VAFAGDMIQHHAQALAMVDLTVGRDLDPEVLRLAEDIRAAQGPEIEQMTDWLLAWDEEIPVTVRDHASDHGGSDMEGMEGMEGMEDMPGMMSAEQMAELAAADDAAFGDLFLAMMIEHHEGAIDMAREQQEAGRYAEAVALAEDIEAVQADEISMMEQLLES